MSIPNRFMDSFVCGTAIATDDLHVHWYAPFANEVTEIGEMGYLPEADVDYAAIKERLRDLKPVDKQAIIDRYERLWAPLPCAEYIVKTIVQSEAHQ